MWNRKANDIFANAMEIDDADKRRNYLDEAYAGDADVRGQVEAMMAASEQAGSFLESPALEMGVDQTIDRPLAEAAGSIIGPYKLLQQIGEGGMGVVFLAEQQQPVRRQVALKVIKAGMDTRQVVARFESERQALALMDHPNIAKVLDAGATDTGRPYFVMELVKGIPITTYCDQRRLTPRERLGLFVQVCQAVQHAHTKGIIHRDLKPTNVLIALYDGKPVPKVIDFGVAKATGGRLTEHTAVFTTFGSVVGTPEYMSPEQAELNQLDVDTRSDVYSLGVILYELLTGTTPVERGRFKAAALLEMLRVVREEEAPRPSTRLSTTDQLASIAAQRGLEPKKLSGLVRGELDWIVMKALEKDRSRRYETANGFALDVQRYLADEAVQACPPSAGYRLRKFARRNKAGLAVGALVLFFLVLLGSGIGWTVRDRSARRANVAGQVESIAAEVSRLEGEQKWPEALAAAKRAEAALAVGEADRGTRQRVGALLKDLSFIDRLEQIRMQSATWYKGSTWDIAREDREYSRAFRDYGVDVDALAVEASIDRLKARPALAIPIAAVLDRWVGRRNDSEGDGASWKRLVAIARGIDPEPLRDRARAIRGRPVSEVRDELRRLVDSIDVRTQHPITVLLLAKEIQDSQAAVRILRDAQEAHPEDFWLNFNLAHDLENQRDLEGAIRFYTAAVSLRPSSAGAHNNLGGILRQQGKFDEAIRHFRKSIELAPDLPNAYSNVGMALRDQKNVDEAIAWFKKAIEVNPNWSGSHNNLGLAYLDLEEYDKAIACFRKALDLDPNDQRYVFNYEKAHRDFGEFLRKQRKFNQAIQAFRKAIEINPKSVVAHDGLGQALRDQNKPDEAIDVLREVIELHPNSLSYRNLGNALRDQNKLDEAINAYRKAIELDVKEPNYHFSLGNALRRQGKLDEAIAAYHKVIDLGWNSAQVYINLGNALRDQKKPDEAIDAFRKAVAIAPQDASAHYYLGLALFDQKKWDEAADAVRKVTELDPKNASAYSNLGAALFNLKKWDDMIAAYRRVIQLEPNSKRAADAYFRIGKALEDQGKLEETVACFQKAVELDPDHAGAHYISLAWLLTNCRESKLRDPHGGLDVARKAVQLAPQSADAWQMLGWAHYRMGDWKACIEALEKSCALQGNPKGGDASQWFFLAMAHWQLGEKDRAHESYDQAVQWMVKNNPGDELLRRFQAEAAELLELKEKK